VPLADQQQPDVGVVQRPQQVGGALDAEVAPYETADGLCFPGLTLLASARHAR
jgi:hypothetical protein